MTPTIGRIVHYVIGVQSDGKPVIRPAIIVCIREESEGVDFPIGLTVHLQVFVDSFGDVKYMGESSKGLLGVSLVRYSEEPVAGTWHWPPRE